MLGRILIIAFTIVAAAAASAAAQTEPVETESETVEERRWYGKPVVIADLAGVGMFVLAGLTDPDGSAENLYVAGILGPWLLGGPIVHLVEGNYGRAGLSLGLRLGLPVVGALVGSLAPPILSEDDCGEYYDECETYDWGAGPEGFLLGFGAAMVIDWVFLSTETVEVERSTTVVPAVGLRRGSFTLGLSGTF